MRHKRTLRENIAMMARGYQILWEVSSANMIWQTVQIIVGSFSPYVGLYMSARIIDEIAAGADWEYLFALALLTVGLQLVLSVTKRLIQCRVEETETVDWNLQNLYFLKVQCRMQYKYFEEPETAMLRTQIRNNSNFGGNGLYKLKHCYQELLGAFIHIILSVSLTVSMLRMTENTGLHGFLAFVNSPLSAVVILLLIALQVGGEMLNVRYFNPRRTKFWSDWSKEFQRAVWYMQWNADTKVMGAEELCMTRIDEKMLGGVWRKFEQKCNFFQSMITHVLNTLLNVALFIYVGAKAYIGVFGIGNFVLYRGTVERFIKAVSDVGSAWISLVKNNDYMEEIFRFLDLPDEMYKGTLAVEKRDDCRYEIEFRNVSFKYPGSDKYALKNISFKFHIGERLAFVGMNGSGKTTFVKLLCRLYDPTEGQILLNGIDITRYRYDEYMALFSVVFQDYFMFGFSLGENVASNLNYDEARVRECLEKAGFGKRLAELERGLETPIGRDYQNDGVNVSGGENQKIALARALYKNAPFIILDEPTAALDPLAEAEVYASFNEIVEERTAIYISHRLSSCRFCDNIVVFHEGEILQYGNHEELIANETGKYYELWNAQAKYYIK